MNAKKERVLITGGSGLVGQCLCKLLLERGYSVALLGRSKSNIPNVDVYKWDILFGYVEKEAFDNVDFIIHLAGAGIAEKRWTIERKKEIVSSRTESAKLIFDNLKNSKKLPKAFISSSAVGFYGAVTSENIFDETSPSSYDFLGDTCLKWEQSADSFSSLGMRVVKIRTGIVLSEKGGALDKLLLPVKFGIGSALGDGKQYMPWIHIDDLCEIYLKAISDSSLNGEYNAVAPEHINNKDFTKVLCRILQKPFWFPNVPSFAMKLLFGEMSQILLKGSRVSSEKIRKTGFIFKHPKLEYALRDLFK